MKVDESSEVKELCFKKQFLKQKLMKIDVSSVKCPSKIPIHLEGEYLSVYAHKAFFASSHVS